ncbi:general L-amino acid transport system substrate-binding protein [Rhizobiales bacterium GAS191]|nr:general L-amino acid transport system substrate-binding protein [Rhizobiales bacterium GAS113]SED83818.1 general L-amino acid transport system substrate-binding protein [Rhizobiales bacterium GAS188]SEE64913.1 general L-amino acid transport system substrate-binding protein [Rhizobiales bacterium GAS191]
MKALSRLIIAGAGLLLAASTALAGTLEDVKARGVLRCGVAPASAGFAAKDAQGVLRGFDVDTCRAIATAVLGDPSKYEVTPLGLRDAFTTLATGGVDVLTHRLTWTFNRDNGTGLEFVQAMFYDGQGFYVRKASGVKSVKDLDGATICVAQGSTTELNIADYFRTHKLQYKIATFADLDEARNAYDAGRCDAWSNDKGGLAARGLGLKDPSAHMLLPETISKEPIGPLVRMGDSAWMHVVRWTMAAVIGGEELGVTSANVDEMRTSSTNPEVKRLLGVGDDLGQKLGLSADWSYRVIKQVGNYGEIYDRNVGEKTPLAIPRGLNALWRDGGLMIAPPFR